MIRVSDRFVNDDSVAGTKERGYAWYVRTIPIIKDATDVELKFKFHASDDPLRLSVAFANSFTNTGEYVAYWPGGRLFIEEIGIESTLEAQFDLSLMVGGVETLSTIRVRANDYTVVQVDNTILLEEGDYISVKASSIVDTTESIEAREDKIERDRLTTETKLSSIIISESSTKLETTTKMTEEEILAEEVIISDELDSIKTTLLTKEAITVTPHNIYVVIAGVYEELLVEEEPLPEEEELLLDIIN